MYSPELARFISKDPKGYVDGMNLYAYVRNNPLRYLDPMGTTARSSSVESPNSFDNFWESAVSGSTIFGAGGDVPVSGKGINTIVGIKHNTEWEGYVDPNAKALIHSLGDNAENWYNKDAPIVKGIIQVGAYALLGARIVQKSIGILYDDAKTLTIGAFTGGLTGVGFGLISNSSGIDPMESLSPQRIADDMVKGGQDND